jgi:hypothetical protein
MEICWIGIGIPFRKCQGTYCQFDGPLPAINISKYHLIKTFNDIENHQELFSFPSVTSCYIDVNHQNG